MTTQIRQLNLSDEEKQALKTRYQETNNRRRQERIQCVLLKGQGLSLEAIGGVVPYNINTISDWIRSYAEAGLEGICVWQYQGSPRHLSLEQQSELQAEVSQNRYSRVQDVVHWVVGFDARTYFTRLLSNLCWFSTSHFYLLFSI